MSIHFRPGAPFRPAFAARFVLLPVMLAGCASLPPPAPTIVSMEQKLSWILRLEDQRVLRDPAPPAVTPAPAGRRRRAPAVRPAQVPDLLVLLADEQARVRRSAALAVGRVKMAEGAKPLSAVLSGDPDPVVRQAAAFALGILGDPGAVDHLRRALTDPDPVLQGRAAEALSLLNDTASAAAIGEMVARQLAAGGVERVAPDDVSETQDPAVEAFRLGVVALGRLKAYEPLAAAVLDGSGRPRVRWWPVAFALQRTEDRRALPALLALARGDGSFGRAFAARALGALKDPAAVVPLLDLVEARGRDPRAAVAAVRSLGAIGGDQASATLVRLLQDRALDPLLLIEAVTAAGASRAAAAVDSLLDLVAHRSPSVRAAALRALRSIDEQNFMVVLSGLDPDPHWSVRAATASVLGTLDREAALPLLTPMLLDEDLRVVPSVIGSLTRLRAPGLDARLLELLRHRDAVIRMAAASNLGELKPPGGEQALAEAYRAGLADDSHVARAAALDALARYGAAGAVPVLREALADKDWAVRLKAAALLRSLDPGADAVPLRPAAASRPAGFYDAPELTAPTVSPQVYIETSRGTVQLQLRVVDAPLTCENFTALARRGFFDGTALHRVVPNFVVQDGDPRGDGEGGPGYTIRDELNERPYLRGTVGMALDGPDTGGSQFFITHSPQPHLDGRYTVFAEVVSGMEVVDRLQPWDTITRVRVWDGKVNAEVR